MELFDICDESGKPTGEIIPREKAHELGLLHRTAHVWVVRHEPPYVYALLQKRAANKDSFPGCLDTSSAGHIPAGQEPVESALRELKEELGIDAGPEQLHFLGTFRIQYEKEFHGKMFRDNEVAFTYLYQEPVDIETLTLQKEELDSVKWVGTETAYLSILRKDPEYCVPVGGLNMVRAHFFPHCVNPVVMEAKKKIDTILQKYDSVCQIAFLRTVAMIIESNKVRSKEDRLSICRLIADTGITKRSPENLSAEWEVHNVSFHTHIERNHARDVDLDYEQDPRFMVRFATDVFETLHLE